MTPIVIYLKDGRLPEDKDEVRRLRIKDAKYVLIDKVLYKMGFSQPYLRCLATDESNYVLKEVHEEHVETTQKQEHLSIKLSTQVTISQLFK